MRTIENINKQYVASKQELEIFRSYGETISEELNNFSVDAKARFLCTMDHLANFVSEADCSKHAFLSNVIVVAMQYKSCLCAIAEYQTSLMNMGKGSRSSNSATVIANANAVKTAQKNFDLANEKFQQEYQAPIKDLDTMNSILLNSIRVAVSNLEQSLMTLQEEARDVLAKECGIELRPEMAVHSADKLPTEMLVARYAVSGAPYIVLRDIGVTSNYANIVHNLKEQGNVLVKTSFENMADDAIDAFVVAYVLRSLETFPLGALNVHIIDNNASFLYTRLCNSFQAENAGEAAGKVVQLHSSMDLLKTFQDVICADIFKKTSASCPDLYSVYENDQTDAFHLIILRDGLVNGNGYGSSEILDAVSALTKINGMGHRCGVRFLIIDDSASFEKAINDKIKFTLGSIQKNCALQLEYANGRFTSGEKSIETLHIVGDLDGFVQNRSQEIADILSSKERAYVSLDEVANLDYAASNESIMYIPIGKSGTEAIQLPLSCKDDNGTVAGQCIGYMAIGQSGSGKSSFFHSVVLNGCLKYSPKDLQFWLLDFKYGGASSKYSKSGLPHIRIIAENNRIDDALCLFQMISEEMDRRNRAFNQNFVDNIVDYNRIAANSPTMEYFPRVIIAIDEVQEIFREDNAAVLQKLISSISVRMRSAGMHFIMVAQNLCEGKAYMLKEAFLPSATGRICFRVAQNIPRDSGFSEDFSQRKQEISELKTGEAYVSYGKGTIRKVKMAYASPEEMTGKYFTKIRAKYPDFTDMKPLVIGSKQRLSAQHMLQKSTTTYFNAISELKPINGIFGAIIGEDAYRMEPMQIRFSQYENSAVMLLGNHKEISSSLCTSIACSLARQGARIHLFNGDKSKIQDGYESFQHPFMYFCQNIVATMPNAQNYKLSEFCDVVKTLYTEYLRRQSEVQKSEDDVPTFEAEFLVVNDLFGIEDFVSNGMVESAVANAPATQANRFDMLASRIASSSTQGGSQFREDIQTIISTLVRGGYRYNIHVVLAIKGDPSTWRNSRIISEVNNIVMFNATHFADQIENSYYLKEMLRNIANENGDETMAVWAGKRSFSKIRPIIYKLSDPTERELIETLIKGV